MGERPIIFSGPMVRALLAGTKTQTRRVLNPAPRLDHFASEHLEDFELRGFEAVEQPDGRHLVYRPRWTAGDQLWVRETWQVARETLDYETGGEYDVFAWDEAEMGDPRPYLNGCARHGYKAGLFYRADGEDKNPGAFYPLTGIRNEVLRKAEIGWRSPIHMPRWASRLTLTVGQVAVERLQDITEEAAQAEGVCYFVEQHERSGSWAGLSSADRALLVGQIYGSSRKAFQHLWETLHGTEAWAVNPWVAALTFTTTPANIDTLPEQQAGGRA